MLLRFASCSVAAAVVITSSYACTWTTVGAPDAPDGAVDARVDTGAARDAVASGTDSGAPGVRPTDGGCVLPVVTDFTPRWKAPSPFGRGICSDTQTEAILTCIFDPNADKATCGVVNADKANQPCADCLVTPDTAKALGPIVVMGQTGTLNISGCIANADGDTGSAGCGAKYEAANECATVYCTDNMPGTDANALACLKTCTDQAKQGPCAAYVAAATCADALLAPGGVAAVCNEGATFLASAIRLGKLFCGAGLGDAAAPRDAPSDG